MFEKHRFVATQIIFSLAIFLSHSVSAGGLLARCQEGGYTISAINGIFTDEEGARNNQRLLRIVVGDTRNGQKIDYQYLLNPSHLTGGGDLIETLSQMLNRPISDHDLKTILLEAHAKVTTRKLLLVGHSQGTFYANEAWDYLSTHGEPKESLGVYNVATPADSVVSGGNYLTSKNDKVINPLRGLPPPFRPPLPANIDIPLSDEDIKNPKGGHAFGEVYLAGAPDRIISDIDSALKKLVATEVPNTTSTGCFTPPDEDFSYRSTKALLAVADPLSSIAATGIAVSGRSIAATGVGIYTGVAVVVDTAHEAAKLVATAAKYFVESTVALAKEVLTGGIGATKEKNVFPNKLSASLLATSGGLVESTTGNNDPVPAIVPPPSRGEAMPPQTTPVAAPVPSIQPPQNSEPTPVSLSSSLQPGPQSAPSTLSPTPPAAPVAFGSVSETPPASGAAATTLPAIQNFQSSFSTSTLLVSFSWSPLGTAATTYKIKDTDTGSVVAETSSSTATFSPSDFTRNYTFSIQAFDGGVALSSIATTTVNVSNFFSSPSTPTNFASSFDSLNLRLTLTWASSTDPDTADNLLSYQFNYSTSSELSATNWVATSSPKVLAVTYPNSYTVGVRAKDNVGKVSVPATLTWSFPSSFASLPSQTDHSYQLPRGKQKISISTTTTIDAVAMWLGGSTGDYCCSQSYMRIYNASGTLTATSEGNANGEITLGATESAHEALYVFDSAVTLNPDTYWLVPTKGPSGTTNSTAIFGSSNDTYADGLWLDVNGADEGRDAYFRVRLAP